MSYDGSSHYYVLCVGGFMRRNRRVPFLSEIARYEHKLPNQKGKIAVLFCNIVLDRKVRNIICVENFFITYTGKNRDTSDVTINKEVTENGSRS